MKTYNAIFQPAAEGGFTVRFPDIENCFTQGDDWEEAFNMAVDVLAAILAETEIWPRPTKAEHLMPQLNAGERLASVPVDERLLHQYKPKVRVNIMLPNDVLKKLDEYRTQTGEDRSSLLAEGAALLLERRGA